MHWTHRINRSVSSWLHMPGTPTSMVPTYSHEQWTYSTSIGLTWMQTKNHSHTIFKYCIGQTKFLYLEPIHKIQTDIGHQPKDMNVTNIKMHKQRHSRWTHNKCKLGYQLKYSYENIARGSKLNSGHLYRKPKYSYEQWAYTKHPLVWRQHRLRASPYISIFKCRTRVIHINTEWHRTSWL